MKVLGQNSLYKINPSFSRGLYSSEEQPCSNDIQEAKEFLGIKNVSLVLHGSSFPHADKDLFIGSPINEKAAEVNHFLKVFGFDSIQLGPSGLIDRKNVSPYSGSVNSKNYLFSDMSKLTTSKYANILEMEDIDNEVSKSYETSTQTDFARAFDSYDVLFEKAYDNLFSKDDAAAEKLKNDFKAFKLDSGKWLKCDAMFSVLKKEYGTQAIDEWSTLDKNLIKYLDNPSNPHHAEAVSRYKEIMSNDDNKKAIDIYKFKQYIVDRQEKEFNREHPEKLDYNADSIIGFSYPDLWANQDAFLPDYRVGCPYGGRGEAEYGSERGCNQDWDIPVIAPKTLFNEDGSLGIGGKLIKQKFEKMLDTYQNIRIDHALGLVDPWIYNKNNLVKRYDADGEVFYSNANGANISRFGKKNFFKVENWMPEGQKEVLESINENIANLPDIDPDHNYSKILEKILLPLLEERGLKPNELVWENLCTGTDKFNEIYNEKLHLPGLTNLKDYQGQGASGDNWFLISSHDDPPAAKVMNNEFFESKKFDEGGWDRPNGGAMKPSYLVGLMYPDKIDDWDTLKHNLSWDTRFRVLTKYEELMRCGKKIQISFMDFFGLDKAYNTQGGKDCWKLRLSKDYQKDYYDTLEKKDWQKVALNMPELYERAVISKALTTNYATNEEHNAAMKKAESLSKRLKHWKEVLYAPEEDAENNDLKKELSLVG